MRRELTEPEALVWAATFAQVMCQCEDPDVAMMSAHKAVTAMRGIRVRGREDQPAVQMFVDFRMDVK